MAKSGLNLSFIFLYLLLILQFFSRISAIRKDTGFQEKRICRNTVQGRYLLSDDNGRVCDALSVDPVSRCCPDKGDKFSCHGCNLLSQCCNSYEYCVSCCLNPLKMLKQHILKVKIAKPATAGEMTCLGREHFDPLWKGITLLLPFRSHYGDLDGTYASVFDFCAGRCRHNSESVVHENAYISEFHHCFSVPSNPSGANFTYLESRLNGINIVVGRQGESCDSVCKSNGQSCVPNKLPVLNQCDIMKKYMRCEGDCLASIGADQPAEVVYSAPKHLNPGACLYTRTQSILSCDGSHQHTRRLCPCA